MPACRVCTYDYRPYYGGYEPPEPCACSEEWSEPLWHPRLIVLALRWRVASWLSALAAKVCPLG